MGGTVRCRSKNKETNKLCCVASHRFVDLPVGLEEAEVHAGFRETPKAARVAPTTFLKEGIQIIRVFFFQSARLTLNLVFISFVLARINTFCCDFSTSSSSDACKHRKKEVDQFLREQRLEDLNWRLSQVSSQLASEDNCGHFMESKDKNE